MDRDEKGRFALGNQGGPGRPPKGESLTDALRESVNKHDLAEKLKQLAMKGDVVALKYIYDRIDGKPVETINSNVVEAPKVIEIVHSDPADPKDIEAVEE